MHEAVELVLSLERGILASGYAAQQCIPADAAARRQDRGHFTYSPWLEGVSDLPLAVRLMGRALGRQP